MAQALVDAVAGRVAADLRGTSFAGGSMSLRIAGDSPVEFRLAGEQPLLSWQITVDAEGLSPREVDVAAAMFPNAVLSCFSNAGPHDPTFAPWVAAVAGTMDVRLQGRSGPPLPHYREVELIRLESGEPGLREVLVHKLPVGLLTSFYESVGRSTGTDDRTIYEVSGDDDVLTRSHFSFYRNGVWQLRFAVERVGSTQYDLEMENEKGKRPSRRLSTNASMVSRLKMALDLRQSAGAPGYVSPLYDLFSPEITHESVTQVRFQGVGPDAAPPSGKIQVRSGSLGMAVGSLSLARMYGYPAMANLLAPARVTGSLGK